MQDFSDFAGLVSSMMDEFGGNATFITQIDTGEYNPATGTNTVVTSEIPIRAILMDLTLQSNGQGTKDKTLIQDGDKVLYVRPTDYLLPILMPDGVLVVDSADDRVIVGGIKYKVVTMKAIDPTASELQPLLYELYIRR